MLDLIKKEARKELLVSFELAYYQREESDFADYFTRATITCFLHVLYASNEYESVCLGFGDA